MNKYKNLLALAPVLQSCRLSGPSSVVLGAALGFSLLSLPMHGVAQTAKAKAAETDVVFADPSRWDTRFKVSTGLVYDEFLDEPSFAGQALEARGTQDQQEVLVRLQGQGRYQFNDQYSLFVKALGFYSTDEIVQASDEDGDPARRYLELKQLYGSAEDLWTPGLRLDVGRKRIKESSGMWFDQNVTLVQMSLERTRFNFSATLAEELGAARTDNTDYRLEDEDQRYLMLSSDVQWRFQQQIGFDYITLKDGSGAGNTGDFVEDDEDPDVAWVNWRLSGSTVTRVGWQLGYDTHFSRQSGHLDRFTSTTASDRLSVSGRLSAVTLTANTVDRQFDKVLGVQWVKTSSSNNPGEEGRFFQTGLESNRVRLRDQRLSLYRFNDAYRPTLQNLEVIGFFFAAQTHHNAGFGVMFNSFRRPNASAPIGDTRYDMPLTAGQEHLGVGTDLVWRYEANWSKALFERHQIRVRLSHFSAGNAYGDVNFDSKLTARLVWEGTL